MTRNWNKHKDTTQKREDKLKNARRFAIMQKNIKEYL